MATAVIPYRIRPDGQGRFTFVVLEKVQLSTFGPSARLLRPFEAVVDSGAGRCVFHAGWAQPLGIDLKSGTREVSYGISGPQEMWLHEVALYVHGGPVRVLAAFQENLPVAGLLGMQGFFEHFTVTFDVAARECRLERIYRA
jgi:hypothetical protein